MEIPKAYNSKEFEDQIYQQWEESGFFNPDNLKLPKGADYFSISMPPPNATGVLHTGHAMMLAIQDLATRYKRMKGLRALWLPGTDHAAIATQAVVEKKLLKENKLGRHELGREKFLAEVRDFVAKSQSTIKKQVKKMGSSCDWSRERYTLDDGLSRAVQEVFVRMYNDGLIYRGYRIVNWCPRCASTLADDEIEYQETTAKLYTFRYGPDFPLAIATTRPETKLGDTAVAVNPKDERYKKYIGKTYTVDLGHGPQEIKIVAEPGVDMEFGTGALGVTPAHSIVDDEIAKKNNLPAIKVIGEDGRMTAEAGKQYAGLTVKEARDKFVVWLIEQGLMEGQPKEIPQNLSVCYRCAAPIEPLPSKQWFINVNLKFKIQNSKLKGIKAGKLVSLKELALNAVKSGEIEIIPDRFGKTYFHWMENLRDWCISRQIWFGHRIPVWYRGEEVFVGTEAPKGDGWKQDEDTLDTWFSSGLWTFSTLLDKDFSKYKSLEDWIKNSPDVKNFHPTSLMETGYDILFFWVARMILMTTYNMGEVPFSKVYLHGMVRDEQGRKMSKSLGNVIDPLILIEKYGADATRLAFLIGNTPGNDTKLSEEKVAGLRNFVNKLWNISRYILTSVKKVERVEKKSKAKTLADEWILARLDKVTGEVSAKLEEYDFSLAGELLRDFTWGEFADWYLEIAKVEKNKDEILLYILENLLKLWHPFIPFVTEAIWGMSFGGEKNLLMVEEWPENKIKDLRLKLKVIESFELVQKIVVAIRNLRSENKVEAAKKIKAIIFAGKQEKLIIEQAEVIKFLSGLGELEIAKQGEKPEQSAGTVVEKVEIYLPLAGMVDLEKEKERVKKEIEEVKKYIATLEKKLSNKEFVDRAPKPVVEAEKGKLDGAKEKMGKLEEQL